MKKILLVAFVLCFSFIKTQAQTITVPIGYATGQCEISRSFGGLSVFSSIDTDLPTATGDGYNLVYTYVDIYITDEDGDGAPEHLFNSIGSPTNTTPITTSAYTSVSTVHSVTSGHTYNVQYEYYALYKDPSGNNYEEYGESSEDVNY
jgi:hypothetical protein